MTQKISSSSNKRLVKNTITLYIRTVVVMLISLYTSRIILNSLGIEDYGTYNVIGGFVSMFSLLGGTLVSATQRFINYEMGRKDNPNVSKVFNTAIGIHIGLSVLLFVVFESFGLWFLNYKLNIPEERMFAANCVYQCSILSFLVNILSLPYNAVIIAHERMKAFAYISLIDAIIKFIIAYSLYFVRYDLLIIYAILILADSLIIRIVYSTYCRKNFPADVSIKLHMDKSAYKRQMVFAGYTFVGSAASILSGQGVNIIMNIFCGVAVNAARGIAVQVQSATEKFVGDFMTALNPQITKTYAAGDKEESIKLVYKGAKMSFFLMSLLSLPIILRADHILDIWLIDYPPYAVSFVRLSLLYSILSVLSKPLITEILATGQIKVNALAIGGIRLFVLPLCYWALLLGYEPTICYFIMISIDVLALNVRLIIVKSIMSIPINRYYKEVVAYIVPVFIISLGATKFFDHFIGDDIVGLLAFIFVSIITSGIVCAFIGLSKIERDLIYKKIISRIHCSVIE